MKNKDYIFIGSNNEFYINDFSRYIINVVIKQMKLSSIK